MAGEQLASPLRAARQLRCAPGELPGAVRRRLQPAPAAAARAETKAEVALTEAAPRAAPPLALTGGRKQEGPSTDASLIFRRLQKLSLPYWTEAEEAGAARWKLAGVVALTLGTTAVRRGGVGAKFQEMLIKWAGALVSRLSLEWRQWMTTRLTADYFAGRAFYRVQVRRYRMVTHADVHAGALVDNPDQRIAVDVRIYPPLFAALLVYSVGGTAASVAIGRPLVGLNFQQEAREANFRYGLARLLGRRLAAAVANAVDILKASRNLSFFTSFYRFLISILPAAVIAPLYFRGEIEFGVINQSSSAFNHILSDVSLVVYQFEAIAGFSAVIDRLGEFTEVLDACRAAPEAAASLDSLAGSVGGSESEGEEGEAAAAAAAAAAPVGEAEAAAAAAAAAAAFTRESIRLVDAPPPPLPAAAAAGAGDGSGDGSGGGSLLDIEGLTLRLPTSGRALIRDLSLSGGWRRARRPYVVLGTLRDQLLYPTWAHPEAAEEGASSGGASSSSSLASGSSAASGGSPASSGGGSAASSSGGDGAGGAVAAADGAARPLPTDVELVAALRAVAMGPLVDRVGGNLDAVADWSSVLSLGEQQRLAFARVLLARPRLVLMDESTSALDTSNEALLYAALKRAGVTYVSVGHRPTLLRFHERVLLLAGGGGGWELLRAEEVTLEAVVEYMD
eukprot:scaffold10.g2377.t1